MRLIVTDASAKIPSLRTAFPADQVVAVDFPLFGRYTKTAKVKSDSWPKLKPIAKAKIDKLVTLASRCHHVVGVFDATTYGKVLARDVQEALCGVNAQVSFLFPDDFRPATIAAAQHTTLETSPDTPFVLDRMITHRLNTLLDSAYNVGAGVELTRQQAYVLGLLHRACLNFKPYAFNDKAGRVFTALDRKIDKLEMKQRQIEVSATPTPLICAPVAWDRLWPAVEKLQAQGLITASEVALPDSCYDEYVNLVESWGLQPCPNPPRSRYLWPTAPASSNARMIIDELAARPLYEWLVIQAGAACCEPSQSVELLGIAGSFKYKGVIEAARSVAPLADINVTPPVLLEQPTAERVTLNQKLIPLREIASAARNMLSERETWSSISWLLRKKLIIKNAHGVYLSSRGCSAAMLLEEAFPDAMRTRLTEIYDDLILEQDDDQRVATLNAFFSEAVVEFDVEYWDRFTRGKAYTSTSHAATFFMPRDDREDASRFMGLVLADGRFRAVRQDLALDVACECGEQQLKTRFNSFYEMEYCCGACSKTYPVTTLGG
jgi:hypothetical protein